MAFSYCFVFAIFCCLTPQAYLQDILNPTETYKCDFESNFCSFLSNDISSQGQWQIGKGKTSPADTGPSVDHTLGNANGSYLYVTSSDASESVGSFHTGILKGDACVQFFYHMYGTSVGTLTVSLSEEKDTYFERIGTQGDRWKESVISITSTASMKRTGYRIQFTVTQKPNITKEGIIAIDDIVLKPGKCENDNKDALLLCSFDSGNCGYVWTERDSIAWEWNKMDRRILGYPLPKNDHTLGTRKGGYWFSGVKKGSMFFPSSVKGSSDLISPLYSSATTSVSCLQFYYYIDGDQSSFLTEVRKANLNVYALLPKSRLSKHHLITKSKNVTHHREWVYAEIRLEIKEPFQIQFNVEFDSSAEALIAIDDVKVLPGECPETDSCDFEDGKCSWIDGDHDTTWGRSCGQCSGIGPNSDHTRNDGTGFYAIMTGDNGTRIDNESPIADLNSKMIPPHYEQLCLSFFYFMNTVDDEKLMVIKKDGNLTQSVIWIRGHQQSSIWRKGMAPLLPSTASTQVTFRGISGTDPERYIALDDIKIRKGEKCDVTPTDMELHLYACHFNPCRNSGHCSLDGETYKCHCKTPFFGKNCEKDPCTPYPCGNNGNCSLDRETYTCDCETPFYGRNCEYNPCTSDPCGRHGNCSLDGGTYKCDCESPFFGKNCEYDTCTSDPCGINGNCSLDGETYKCDCETPFYGRNCKFDPCTSDPCRNNGSCSLDRETFKCDCQTPFFGKSCENGPCTSNPCRNNGTCKLDGETYKCDCQTPFYGKNCEYNPCTSDPCGNNGNCSLDTETYKCDCETPFYGKNCEYNPCTSDPCGNNGNCSLNRDTYKCDCHPPFFGKNCEYNPCTSYPCGNNGNCSLDGNRFKCDCKTPYFGRNCENDPCTSYPCGNNGNCSLDGNTFKCDCKMPYFGRNCESVLTTTSTPTTSISISPKGKASCFRHSDCQNGGFCNFERGECVCRTGTTGEFCQGVPACQAMGPFCRALGATCRFDLDRDEAICDCVGDWRELRSGLCKGSGNTRIYSLVILCLLSVLIVIILMFLLVSCLSMKKEMKISV